MVRALVIAACGACVAHSVLAASATVERVPGVEAWRDDGVVLLPKFEMGQEFFYRLKQTSEREWIEPSRDDGQPVKKTSSTTLECDLRFTVIGVEGTGAAVLSCIFEKMGVERTVDGKFAGGTTMYGSGIIREGDPPPRPGTSVERGPTGTPMHDCVGALMASVIRFDLAPDGSVTLLTGLDTSWRNATEHGREGQELLGPFASLAAKMTLASMFRVDSLAAEVLPVRRVEGQSWTLTDIAAMGAAGSLQRESMWMLESIKDGVATLRGTPKISIAAPAPAEEDAALQPKLDVTEQSGEMTAKWNTRTGRLEQRTGSGRVVMTSTLGSGEGARTSSTTAHNTLEITRIDKPDDGTVILKQPLPPPPMPKRR
jgi:hypothetical protein